jgi:DNA topoisomerase-3
LKLVPDRQQSPELTGQWEARLEAIADGKGHAGDFMQGIRELTCAVVEVAKGQQGEAVATVSTLGPCPKCRQGTIREGRKGWDCSRWREGCDFVIWRTVAGKKLTGVQAKTLLSGRATAQLKGFKSKEGKSFSARLKLDEQFHVVFDFDAAGSRQRYPRRIKKVRG